MWVSEKSAKASVGYRPKCYVVKFCGPATSALDKPLPNRLLTSVFSRAYCVFAFSILAAIAPERYNVLDFRALEALGYERHNVEFYTEYVAFCHRVVERGLVKPQPDLPGPTALHALDRALWEWSRKRAE